MKLWMFSCHRVMQKLSQSFDAPLSRADRFWMDLHIRLCKDCTVCKDQFGILRNAGRCLKDGKTTVSATLPQTTRERMKERLRKACPQDKRNAEPGS